MRVEFDIRVVDDAQMLSIASTMKERHGIKLDDMLVVEGCLNDDKTVLGGKFQFLNHFCTFFNFDACHGAKEAGKLKKISNSFSDPDEVDKRLESFLAKMDGDMQ